MFRSCVVLALLAASSFAHAESRAKAVRRTGAITIDGKLDEAAWESAPKQHGFTQRLPKFGGKAANETTFAVLYDDQAIYVGVWADDPEPQKIRRTLTRRDVDALADAIAIGFDSYRDKRTAFVFQLNAAGVQRDMLLFDDSNQDDTWDAVWTGDAAVTERGWSAEFRIPLNQLRFSAAASHEWGLQVVRMVARTNEQSSWSPWPRTGSQIVSVFGVVDGIDKLQPGRRLELLPYMTGGFESTPVEDGDPLADRYGMVGNVGVDLKYGLGSAFTLSATINPDFGQVEADPSRVNLSASELFFDEKRPFFLEGVDLFKLPLDPTANGSGAEGQFYSRRIGAAPTGEPADYEFIQYPTATTIYSAAKLTGKARGWSVGVLDAVTGEESATIVDGGGMMATPTVAPLTNFAVARVKRDLREGKTSFGASATAVHRQLGGTGLEAQFHDQAYTLGTQVSHKWDKDAWEAYLATVGSAVHGSTEAIANTQTSQVHLFQRPDTFRLDPERTSLVGGSIGWAIGRMGDTKHWRWATGGTSTSPGLELNDAGFQRQSDLTVAWVWGGYHEEEPSDDILSWRAESNVFSITTSEPRLTDIGWEGNASAQLANYWFVNFGFGLFDARWDRGALRGGESLRRDPLYNLRASVSSDGRKPVVVTVGIGGGRKPTEDSGVISLDGGVTIQARSNIDVFIGPGWSRNDDAMQFVEQTADEAGRPHFVFARIDQSTVAMTARVNWTFSPKLSLQAYAQPFVSTGKYREYKDVDRPGARKFEDRFHAFADTDLMPSSDGSVFTASNNGTFSFSRPDFAFAQIRSNVVVRWEYRPGSSLFAIWSHGQTATGTDGQFHLGRDLRELSDAQAEDIVMVKLNYWIGL
jgi:hypothetical protein